MYTFFIWANDTDNNQTISETHTFKVGIPPEITQVEATPSVQDQGGSVNITCTVTDNILVDTVLVNITYPNSTIYSILMTNIAGTDNYYHNTTYMLNGTYSFFIFANDTQGNSNVSEIYYFYIGLVFVDIPLNAGWNLITIPVVNSFWASTLAENITGCQFISKFDGVAQSFWTYTGNPASDFAIADGYGYMLYTTEASMLSLSGLPITSVSVPIYAGWNVIGWYHDYNTTASSICENISGCQFISKFDGVAQSFWTYTGNPASDFVVSQSMGLMLYTTESSIWNGEG
jgi:hypothetical protein